MLFWDTRGNYIFKDFCNVFMLVGSLALGLENYVFFKMYEEF